LKNCPEALHMHGFCSFAQAPSILLLHGPK
jgi:hypothetical protein